MSVINTLSSKVADNLVKTHKVDKAVAFDPTIIMVIIQAIQMAFEALKNCKKDPVASTVVMNTPNFMQRFLLKRMVSKTGVSFSMRNKVYEAMLDTGKTLKVEDLNAVNEELNFDLM